MMASEMLIPVMFYAFYTRFILKFKYIIDYLNLKIGM